MLALLPQHFLYWWSQDRCFENTLTFADKWRCAFLCLLYLFVYSGIGLYYFNRDRKRLSGWVASVVALTTVVDGVLYMWLKMPLIFRSLTQPSTLSVDLLQSDDDFAIYACIWFGVGCAWEVAFGYIFYRERQDLVNVYIHHGVLILTCLGAATASPTTGIEPFAAGFTLMAVEDVTSLVMALGIAFPALRSDALFGGLFFVLRILYHSVMFVYAIVLGVNRTSIGLFALAMIMQIYWMRLWAKKYLHQVLARKTTNKRH